MAKRGGATLTGGVRKKPAAVSGPARKVCEEAGLPATWFLVVSQVFVNAASKTLDGVEIFAGVKALTRRRLLA